MSVLNCELFVFSFSRVVCFAFTKYQSFTLRFSSMSNSWNALGARPNLEDIQSRAVGIFWNIVTINIRAWNDSIRRYVSEGCRGETET